MNCIENNQNRVSNFKKQIRKKQRVHQTFGSHSRYKVPPSQKG